MVDVAWEPLAIVGAVAACASLVVVVASALADPPLAASSEKTLDMIEAAIPEEKEAIEDYTNLENRLRSEELTDDADTVKEIKNDETDHKAKFEAMFRKLAPQRTPISCI